MVYPQRISWWTDESSGLLTPGLMVWLQIHCFLFHALHFTSGSGWYSHNLNILNFFCVSLSRGRLHRCQVFGVSALLSLFWGMDGQKDKLKLSSWSRGLGKYALWLAVAICKMLLEPECSGVLPTSTLNVLWLCISSEMHCLWKYYILPCFP